jgi:hypothetical protein
MEARTSPRCSRLLLVAAAVALTTGAGCVPDVAWLPDSSGIVYTATDWPGPDRDSPKQPNGRLVHYDLAKKASRVVAETGTDTIQPALSPDGKRVAVASLNWERGNPPTLRVIVYDLGGKEVLRSKAFPWGEEPRGDVGIEKYAQLFWAPQGNRVLVRANKHSGICDLDGDRAVMLGPVAPMIYGTTPIRPDGKSFLIAREDRAVGLVDWEGKQTPVELPAGLSGLHWSLLSAPVSSCWARWEGDAAVATWKGGRLRIDTGRRVATLGTPDKAEWASDDKEVQHIHTFPDGKTKIVVVYLLSPRDFRDAGLPTVRVDLVGPEPGMRRALIPETFHCGVYPSPNKELVALRYVSWSPGREDRPRDMIWVVNRKGDVVADIEMRR